MNKIPTIKQAEKILKRPAKEWKGHCHTIAMTLLSKCKLISGRCVYGHWLGPVNRKSFFTERRGMPFIQHGWIVSDKKIIDPTRWVFEGVEPYIFYGKDTDEYYDEGGNKWREAGIINNIPEFDFDEKTFPVVLDEEVHDFISELLCDEYRKELSLSQMFWLANLSPETLGSFCKKIYTWFDNIGCGVFIPIDNRIMIFGKKYISRSRKK